MDNQNNENDVSLSSHTVHDLKKSIQNAIDETAEIIEEFQTQIISNTNNIGIKRESMTLINDILKDFKQSSDTANKSLNQLSDLLISKEEE